MTSEAINCDCLEYMRTLPDRFFDLLIADPPYGDCDGSWRTGGGARLSGGAWAAKYRGAAAWDVAPPKEAFDEMFRVSRNQIIWGGNYFGLPPCRCFVVWDKKNISPTFTMAMCEFAWTSFKGRNAKLWRGVPQGSPGSPRFHPTQKPVGLYKFVLEQFAEAGDKVFDPYMGSGSSRIACRDLGFDYWGCEVCPEYFEKAERRFAGLPPVPDGGAPARKRNNGLFSLADLSKECL